MSYLRFDSENLKVDYLSLNLQFDDPKKIQEIADFLADTLHCNSTLLDRSNKKKSQLTVTRKNSYSAEFVINSNKHWKGSILRFSGNHARWFYENLKFKKLNWSIFGFESVNLGRIDICYDRKLKEDDRGLDLFFENSLNRILRNNNLSAERGKTILRVGKRSSPNFFRVYLKPNGRELRFEVEIKKTVAKTFQHYLFTNQFDLFEDLLIAHFYNQAIKLFDLESSYCDWLIANFRRIRKPPLEEVLINSLSISYLTEDKVSELADVEFLYRLIQLLNYIKRLKMSSKSVLVDDVTYTSFEFPVNDFLVFIGKPKNNHYQVKKLVEFLKSLRTIEPVLEHFADGGFREYVVFPYVKVERRRCWWVVLHTCWELDSYRYPFYFPEAFLQYQNNYELKVKFILLQSFCNVSVRKELPTQDFLGQISVSNSNLAVIKGYIVEILNELKDLKVIEPKFIVLTKKNGFKEVSTLTSRLVNQSKSIFYTENIYR